MAQLSNSTQFGNAAQDLSSLAGATRTAKASLGVSIATMVVLLIVLALGIVTLVFLFTVKKEATEVIADVKRTTTSVRNLTEADSANTLLELPAAIAAMKKLFHR